MKFRSIHTSLVLGLMISISAQAQPCQEQKSDAVPAQIEPASVATQVHAAARKGTYQFFIIGEDSTQLLRTDLAEKIESYRDDHTIVHLKVSSTTTIRILPRSEINDPHFMPLAQEVIFQPDFAAQTAKK